MADNTTNAVGDTIAADEVTVDGDLVKLQRVKAGWGADGSWNETAAAAPLPVNAIANTSLVQNGTAQLTPKYAYKNLTASGDIVAAVASKKIRVLAFHVDEEAQVADAVLTVEDASAGDDLAQFAGMDLQAKGLAPCVFGWFETTAGNALYGTVAGTSPNFNICVVYVEV